MKKVFASVLVLTMILACAVFASAAETTIPDVTFEGWWGAHSQGIEITEEGFTMTFFVDTVDGAAANYCTPSLVIHNGSADTPGMEYWVQRADAWGWLYGENIGDNAAALQGKGYSWTYTWDDSFISWEKFQTVTEAGAEAVVTAKLEGTNVLVTYKLAGVNNEVTIPVDAANPVYLCLAGERCAVSNIVVTTPDPNPAADNVLNIAVWTKDGAWVTADELAAIKTGFEAYLTEKGYNPSELTINYVELTTEGNKVADLGALVNEAGDFDIIIGCGNNINSTAGVSILEKAKIPTGRIAADRMVAKLTEDPLAAELYAFVTSEPPVASCEHTNTKVEGAVAATCTEAGFTGNTICADCGETVTAGTEIAAKGHTYVDGKCVCGAEDPNYVPPKKVTITIGSASLEVEESRVAIDQTLTNIGNYAFIVYTPKYEGTIAITNGWGEAFVLDETGVIVRIYDGANGKYYDADNKGGIKDIDKCKDSTYLAQAIASLQAGETLIVAPNNAGAGNNTEPGSRWFLNKNKVIGAKVEAFDLTFGTPACQHTNTEVKGAMDAVCEKEGYTGDTYCVDCGEKIADGENTPALEHNYVDGECTLCHNAQTGDVFGIVVALMAASGTALVALKKKEN